MNKGQKLKMQLLMMKDAIEMDLIYRAVRKGKSANEACAEVIGGSFNLSPLVTEGVEKHVSD